MELSTCPAGTVARVRLIDLPPDECARLRELGLAPETQVQVVQCGLFKSRVIAIGSDRFAIDGKTCRCIELYDDGDENAINPVALTHAA